MVDKMTIGRLGEVLDAYGSDPLRWPAEERLALQALAARDPHAAAMIEEAESLDRLLNLAPVEAPSAALTARVLAGRPKPSLGTRLASVWTDLFPGTAAWKPALGFVAALAMGTGLQAAAADQLGLTESADVATTSQTDTMAPLTGYEPVSEEDIL